MSPKTFDPRPPAWQLDWRRLVDFVADGTADLTPSVMITVTSGLLSPFDWSDWSKAVGANDWVEDLDHLATLPLRDVRRLLTTLVRMDRFSDGTLDWAIDRGIVAALFARAAQLVGRVAGQADVVVCQRADITTLEVDAIVNAANERMLGRGGVDGVIHRAAGPGLVEACRTVEEVRPGVRCPTGEARITPGFDLPATWVVHTVGPVWRGGEGIEADLLSSAYSNSLLVAMDAGARTVAFPAISTGVFGYPPDEAAAVAVGACLDVLADHPDRLDRIVLAAHSEGALALLAAAVQSCPTLLG